MKRRIIAVILLLSLFLTACSAEDGKVKQQESGTVQDAGIAAGEEAVRETSENAMEEAGEENLIEDLIDEAGMTVQDRFRLPEGFERTETEAGSFGEYLRNLPLKPHGSEVRYFDGSIKPHHVHEAVIDMDIGERDLQQCADAVMRLWAEYLYGKGLYEEIHFNFTNGFKAEYIPWRQGSRIKVQGNKSYWVKQGGLSDDYGSFRKYLEMVFAYAGTLSLSRELKSVPLDQMKPGDIFIKGGSPGHCVIVVDMAVNPASGQKYFLLAQSYMPAQDIHVLKNPENGDGNPWYTLDFGETLVTPEWAFTKDQLMRFGD